MNKTTHSVLPVIFFCLMFIPLLSTSQNPAPTTPGSPDKKYFFQYDITLSECQPDGTLDTPKLLIPQGTAFTIVSIKKGVGYIITINAFTVSAKQSPEVRKSQIEKQKTYNFITMPAGEVAGFATVGSKDNRKRFFITDEDFAVFAIEKGARFPLDFGTLIEPFKFRSRPSQFTTNLSLGAIVGFQKNFPRSDYTWGLYAGLSLSSVTLDSFSTKGTVLVNSDRPALTPSINGLIGYKTINITIGIGWDIINQTSSIEKSWVYNGKPWIGLGIGVKLFTANNSTVNPAPGAQASGSLR